MSTFLLKRICWALLVLLVVASLTFLLSRVVPADPAAFLAGQNASAETVARIRTEYGLDRPLSAQFVGYLADLLHGDFGLSLRTKRPVSADLANFLPATLELLFASFFGYIVLSLALAVAAARRPGGKVDAVIRLFTMLGSGIPVFWLGMALQFLFFYKLGLFPLGGRFPLRETPPPTHTGFLLVDSVMAGQPDAFFDALRCLVLPSLAIVLNLLAVGTRMSRAALIQEYGQQYVRTARGKGVGAARILWKHVFRNALAPLLTVTSMQFGYMISWVILVEVIFGWPGIGLYAYQSFQVLDYAPVVALAVVSTAVFSLINLLLDLAYPLIDPRMRSVRA